MQRLALLMLGFRPGVGLSAFAKRMVGPQYRFRRVADAVGQPLVEGGEVSVDGGPEQLVIGTDHEIRLLEVVDPVFGTHHALESEAQAVGRGVIQGEDRFVLR